MTGTRALEEKRSIEDLKLIGGHPALDFCNTTGAREREAPNERLHGYADLVQWSARAEVGVLTQQQADALLCKAEETPDEADAAFRRALELRETLFHIFAEIARSEPPPDDELAELNTHVAETMGRLRLRPDEENLSWKWRAQDQHLEGMCWPIVRAAADLLTAGDLARLKICAGDACGWLFLDQSRNRSRRWCAMGDCGNVAKARRYRRRHRAEST